MDQVDPDAAAPEFLGLDIVSPEDAKLVTAYANENEGGPIGSATATDESTSHGAIRTRRLVDDSLVRWAAAGFRPVGR